MFIDTQFFDYPLLSHASMISYCWSLMSYDKGYHQQVKETFQTNIFGMMFLSQAAVPYLNDGDTIINTTSVTAYRGSGH